MTIADGKPTAVKNFTRDTDVRAWLEGAMRPAAKDGLAVAGRRN
jgi:hypothetical protein